MLPSAALRPLAPGVDTLSITPETVIVVSDLHLALGRDPETGRFDRRENFFADAEFGEFLEAQAPEGPNQALLVLNGDIFDFLRVPTCPQTDRDFEEWRLLLLALGHDRPIQQLRRIHKKERRFGLRTDDYKSVWKLQQIARGHRPFFDALGSWVDRGGWVLLVKGNHDVELFWRLVQDAVRWEIKRSFPQAPVSEHVLFAQAGVQLGNLYFEHGHQHESLTAVKGPPTLAGGAELNLPLGSFVNRYIINALEGLEPFLDNIKPRNELLWRLFRRHPLRSVEILWRAVPFIRRAARPYWLRDSMGFALYFLSLAVPFLTLGLIVLAIVFPELARFFGDFRVPLSVAGVLAPYLVGFGRDLYQRYKPPPKVGENHYAQAAYHTLRRLGWRADFPVVYGVLGHTHEPDVQKLPAVGAAAALYLNAGTWAPIWSKERPDLTGRVIYSFLRFRQEAGGFYRHESRVWRPDRRAGVDATILAGARARRGQPVFLSARERSTVAAFAEVFIEGAQEVLSPAEVADNIDRQLSRIRSKRTRSLRLALFVIEYVLPLLSLRAPFSSLSAAARKRLIARRLANPRASLFLRNLAKIRTLFLAGYYGDARVHASIGFVPVAERPREPPGPIQPIGLPALRLGPPRPGEHTIDTDVCVVGSGAGGAVVACNAAASGRRVVLLEEGPYVPGPEISHDEGLMSASLYKEGGLQTTVDLGMTILQGRCLGGTTVINNAICFRIGDEALQAEHDRQLFRRWAELGAQVDEGKLETSYQRVEAAIGAALLPERIRGKNGAVLLDGWDALLRAGLGDPAFKSGWFRKNYNRCEGCGYCNFGCPYDRKMSMLETYVTRAIDRGARVITGCHAMGIETRGRKARSVRCVLADGGALEVRAQKIVVACGAIGSSVLLLKSGIRRNVGTRFSFNAATPVFAQFPFDVSGFDGVQMASYVDSGRFLLESAFNPPMAFAATLPGWFSDHFERMAGYRRLASVGVVVGTEANGRVKRRRFLRDLLGPVAYTMTGRDLDTMRHGMALLAQIYFAAGAEAVYPATFVDLELKRSEFVRSRQPDGEQIKVVLEKAVRHPRDVTLNSSHPQGGNPMSDDARIGVVDSRFRVHGFENLYVCDASVFPTTIRINPQLTIMALADYAWHHCIG